MTMNFGPVRGMVAMVMRATGSGCYPKILRNRKRRVTLPGPEACLLLNEYGSHGLLARPD